jgi:hypothetical protein
MRVEIITDHVHPPPAQQRRKEHQYRPGSVSLLFVILPRRLARGGRYRRLDVVVQFLAGLVHGHQRFVLLQRASVGVQHLLHLRDEPGRGVFRDTEPLLAPGLQDVFFTMIRSKAKMNRDSVFPVDREGGDVALTIAPVS